MMPITNGSIDTERLLRNRKSGMTFKDNFTIKDRIELLERWVLVQSYIYYELNDNVSSDFNYDNNVRQLVELMQAHPDEFQLSRYYPYFDDFDPDCTSGFNLLQKVKKKLILTYICA